MAKYKLRSNTCAIFTPNDDFKTLYVFQRVGENIFQFPQGGLDPLETLEEGIRREVFEEIGIDSFIIKKSLNQPVPYFFPPEVKKTLSKRIGEVFDGQNQYYFHCHFHEPIPTHFDYSHSGEFSSFKLMKADEFLEQTIDFKKEAYKQGLALLGLL